jgi:hypothetical protein
MNQLVTTAGLAGRLVALFAEPDVMAAGKTLRRGNIGVAIKLANMLNSTCPDACLAACPDWQTFASDTLHEINETESK